jgi:hypothetical protein
MQRPVWLVTLAFTLAALTANGLAQTLDLSHFVGTWKVSLAKSKFTAPIPPVPYTRVHEDRGGGLLHLTQQGPVNPRDIAFLQSAFKCDGKEYPWLSRGASAASSISCRVIDAYGFEYTLKTERIVSATGTYTVSKDGKTLTIRPTNPEGQPTGFFTVFEKQ